MALELTIAADHRNEYRIRTLVAGREVDLLVDSGFTQSQCLVGVELEAASYDVVRLRLRDRFDIQVQSGGGELRWTESGIGSVEVVGLDSSLTYTPVARGAANLLGVCYFHRLPAFHLSWDLAARTMTLRRS